MKIADIMITDVIQISPDDPVGEAAKRMYQQSVGCLVATVTGVIKGIITDRDLLACLQQHHDPYQCKVAGHMSRPVLVIKPEEEASTGIEVMRNKRVKRLPVMQSGHLVGIISLSDLAAVARDEMKSLSSSLTLVSDLVWVQSLQIKGRTAPAGDIAQTAAGLQPSPKEHLRTGFAAKHSS